MPEQGELFPSPESVAPTKAYVRCANCWLPGTRPITRTVDERYPLAYCPSCHKVTVHTLIRKGSKP